MAHGLSPIMAPWGAYNPEALVPLDASGGRQSLLVKIDRAGVGACLVKRISVAQLNDPKLRQDFFMASYLACLPEAVVPLQANGTRDAILLTLDKAGIGASLRRIMPIAQLNDPKLRLDFFKAQIQEAARSATVPLDSDGKRNSEVSKLKTSDVGRCVLQKLGDNIHSPALRADYYADLHSQCTPTNWFHVIVDVSGAVLGAVALCIPGLDLIAGVAIAATITASTAVIKGGDLGDALLAAGGACVGAIAGPLIGPAVDQLGAEAAKLTAGPIQDLAKAAFSAYSHLPNVFSNLPVFPTALKLLNLNSAGGAFSAPAALVALGGDPSLQMVANTVGKIANQKLGTLGRSLLSDPTVASAKSIADKLGQGAAFLQGLAVTTGKSYTTSDFQVLRGALTEGNARKAFDMGVALSVGHAVVTGSKAPIGSIPLGGVLKHPFVHAHPKRIEAMSPAARAGFLIVGGMPGISEAQRVGLMTEVAAHPLSREGAIDGVQHIAATHMGVWDQILAWLGFLT